MKAGLASVGVHIGMVATGLVAMRYSGDVPSFFSGRETIALPWLASSAPQVAAPVLDVDEEVAATLEEAPPLELPQPTHHADTASRAPDESAPRGHSPDPRAPAPDEGEGPGRALPTAWRRDRSTLRARLTDGAGLYQPSHERTGARASSPQALRREETVGIGDSRRTQHPTATDPVPPSLPPEAPREPLETSDAPQMAAAAAVETRPAAAPNAETRGEGPLDAERGARSYDIGAEGVARDNVAIRAASDEARPGLMDLSAAAAAGAEDGVSGRGPAETPGAAVHPARGVAPSAPGVTQGIGGGRAVALNALERPYSREHLEIRLRVARSLRFPKRLALMLEQGETIVRFHVTQDGRIRGGIQVIKSAGFEEFDREAIGSVERAAPFPPMKAPLLVTMPITFENPVIR